MTSTISLRLSDTYASVNSIIIGSDNGLSPGQRQAIIWTNIGILWIGPLGRNLNEILIAIHTFPFKKIHLKMLSGKWLPFSLSLNVVTPTAQAATEIAWSESMGCKLRMDWTHCRTLAVSQRTTLPNQRDTIIKKPHKFRGQICSRKRLYRWSPGGQSWQCSQCNNLLPLGMISPAILSPWDDHVSQTRPVSEVGQYHDGWCPGSQLRQINTGHGIDYRRFMSSMNDFSYSWC